MVILIVALSLVLIICLVLLYFTFQRLPEAYEDLVLNELSKLGREEWHWEIHNNTIRFFKIIGHKRIYCSNIEKYDIYRMELYVHGHKKRKLKETDRLHKLLMFYADR